MPSPDAAPPQPSKEQLLRETDGDFDTESLRFVGLRGDRSCHLDRTTLEQALAALAPAPRDVGTIDLMVARGASGERHVHAEACLTVAGGMPGDRWARQRPDQPDSQLATANSAVARLIANGQPLELHGDNLYLDLDLTPDNLPIGSLVRVGKALLRVTKKPHNGCKKWVQRFGLAAMQLNMATDYRARRLRGIYLTVVEPGLIRAGDGVRVTQRATPSLSNG